MILLGARGFVAIVVEGDDDEGDVDDDDDDVVPGFFRVTPPASGSFESVVRLVPRFSFPRLTVRLLGLLGRLSWLSS